MLSSIAFASKSFLELSLRAIFLLSIFLAGSLAMAGEFNPDRNIGDVAPAWVDLPGTDGKLHSMKDLSENEVIVVAFTCNSCPYAVDYQGRINKLAEKYHGSNSRVCVVAINVNQVPQDSLEKMKEVAKKGSFLFPYIYDASQKIAKEFGAGRTPEFFVLNKDRKIVYMGAFDDNTKEADVTKHYVEDAITATLEGNAVPTAETNPVGCAIRWAKERRKAK